MRPDIADHGSRELPTSKTETEIDPDEEGLLLIDSRVAAKNAGAPCSWILTPGSSMNTALLPY
jgi:hypothetical protein